MSRVVRELIQAIPSDMEQEKAMLVLAMVLTKKIVNTVPFLLRRVFDTTVNYMNRQFHNYIVDMVSAVKLLCGSHSQPFSCPGLFPEGWPSSGLPVACWFPCSALEVGPEGNASPCRALEMSVLQGVMSHLLAPPTPPLRAASEQSAFVLSG